MNVSDYAARNNTFRLKAGTAITQNDLLELGPDGKCYPVQVTDYAAVNQVTYGTAQTNAATGQIVAQTQVVAGQTLAYSRQAVLQGDDGSIFTFTNNSGANGLLLSKYSAAGALVSSVTVDATATAYTNQHILKLSNGNIAVAAFTGTALSYAVYDQNLNLVKAFTSVGEASSSAYFSACALSTGGFAVAYQQNTNQLLSRLATFDNTGTAVLAPTTIWTRTGTTGTQYHRMAQLSNGNLAVAVSSTNTVSSIGLFHGVVTTAGVSVLAFTSLDTTSVSIIPELSVMTGYYAISRPNNGNQLGFVFDNTGALQGAGFTAATTAGATGGTTLNLTKLVNDGTAFYLIWPRSSDSKEVLTKLPVTGTGYSTTIITTSGTLSNYNLYIDAFYENGFIVGVSVVNANYQPALWVARTDTGALVSTSVTFFGALPGTNAGQYQRVIPGGDFSFICLYDYASTAGTNLAVGKYANTAVMGVAQAAAAADALVPVAGVAGGYAANYVKGSASKAFDHLTTNINGNKGTLMNYGTVLKGF